ncbi:MAG: ankyrin repeat domain-containing protein [Gammaproteobacteria bacterium]|nr:ankyrin repeat domain-containing protein [Gammaproteobacteria bacterium]
MNKNLCQLARDDFWSLTGKTGWPGAVIGGIVLIGTADYLHRCNIPVTLHTAAANGDFDEFRRLVQRGSDTRTVNNGKTPIELAHQTGQYTFIKNCAVFLARDDNSQQFALAIGALYYSKIFNQENFDILVANPQDALNIVKLFIAMDKAKMLTLRNRVAIIARAEHAEKILPAFSLLPEPLRTQENFEPLLVRPEFANNIAKFLVALHTANILSPRTRIISIEKAEHAEKILQAFRILPELLRTQENLEPLVVRPEFAQDIARLFIVLDKAEMRTPRNRDAIVARAEHAGKMASSLYKLAELRRTQGFFDALVTTPLDSDDVVKMLIDLQKAKILTPENRDAFVAAKPENMRDIEALFSILPPTQEIFSMLIEFSKNMYFSNHSSNIWCAFFVWPETMRTQANLDAFITTGEYSGTIGGIFGSFKLPKELHTQAIFDALVAKPQYASDIANLFVALGKAGILIQKNRTIIVDRAKDADKIWLAFVTLPEPLRTQEHFEVFATTPQYALDIAQLFVALDKAGIPIPENREAIVARPADATKLLSVFDTLPALLRTQENLNVLVANPQYALDIAELFVALDKARRLTPGNRAAIVANPENAGQIYQSFIALPEPLRTQENFNVLVANPKALVHGLTGKPQASYQNYATFTLWGAYETGEGMQHNQGGGEPPVPSADGSMRH